MMKKQTIIISTAIVFTVLAVVLFAIYKNKPISEKMLGGDRDEHGCIGSAGYSWCESKNKCLRIWEETCDADENAGIERWKTYRNKKYGFQLLYPNDWSVSESSLGAVTISGTDGSIRLLGVEVSPPYSTANEELSVLASRFGAQVEPVAINGISGIKRDDDGGGRTYYLENGKTYAEIMTNKEQMEKNENIGKIIATFKFVQ